MRANYAMSRGLTWLFGAVALIVGTRVSAQDIHFTQFYAAPMNISPALTGIFAGESRLMTNFRSQWHSVPVDF
jgi:hypothetical protein